MADIIERILIGYGSESGKAQALATRLGELPFLHPYAPTLLTLNEISPADLGKGDLLLIVSSSFGDGEPPANAELFSTLWHTRQTSRTCATPFSAWATRRTRVFAVSRNGLTPGCPNAARRPSSTALMPT